MKRFLKPVSSASSAIRLKPVSRFHETDFKVSWNWFHETSCWFHETVFNISWNRFHETENRPKNVKNHFLHKSDVIFGVSIYSLPKKMWLTKFWGSKVDEITGFMKLWNRWNRFKKYKALETGFMKRFMKPLSILQLLRWPICQKIQGLFLTRAVLRSEALHCAVGPRNDQ